MQALLLVYWFNMLQVSDSHEGSVEVVQLQNAGQQEEARDQNTAEELRQSKCLQTNGCQPEDDKDSCKLFINKNIVLLHGKSGPRL